MDITHLRTYILVCSLAVVSQPLDGLAQQQQNSPASNASPRPTPAARDAQHDFEFEIGAWKTHLSRLVHPLTGSTTWVEYDGTTVVRKIWNGRANLLELEVDGPSGHIEALSLRLYNPDSRQWSLNFASSAGGTLSQPTIGEFKNRRGEFFDQETYNGRAILVRFVISDITPDSCHFEQAFSDDGGKTWEVNWIATDMRVKDASQEAPAPADAAHGPPPPSGSRESLTAAWWTGPMLAPNATTLPRGHFLLEPYLYDVIGPHSNGFGSLTYINYGLAEKLTVGLIPTAGYNKVSDGPSSSSVGLGDLTVQAQYRLTKFHEGGWIPTTSAVVQETFPSGKYDRLGNRPSDGLGSGAYTTTAAFYSQTYFWLPTGRILRARLDLSEAFPDTVKVEDASVYGTAPGFRGHAHPGTTFLLDAAAEYSLTRSWVLALDVTYRRQANTRITGSNAAAPTTPVQLNTGANDAVGFAPAIEYNWKPTLGVLLGTRIIAIGHNTPVTITPAVAINIVH